MELTQAIDILKRSVATKQEETDVLKLALSVLEGTFAPELKVLDSLRAQVDEKDGVISEKVAEIQAISTEKVTLEARVKELEKPETVVTPEEVTPVTPVEPAVEETPAEPVSESNTVL